RRSATRAARVCAPGERSPWRSASRAAFAAASRSPARSASWPSRNASCSASAPSRSLPRSSTSGEVRVNSPREVSWRTKLSLLQPASTHRASTTSNPRDMPAPVRISGGSPRGKPLAEFGLAPGAVHHLSLELPAGSVDVVAAGAAHGGQHPGFLQQLLEGADVGLLRALVARARERVERDQVDLG